MDSFKSRTELSALLKLIEENPNLPVIPMVNGEVVDDDRSARWLGLFGGSYVAECITTPRGEIHVKDDDEEEMSVVISELYSSYHFLNMSEDEVRKAYANLAWVKAIVVNIDCPVEYGISSRDYE